MLIKIEVPDYQVKDPAALREMLFDAVVSCTGRTRSGVNIRVVPDLRLKAYCQKCRGWEYVMRNWSGPLNHTYTVCDPRNSYVGPGLDYPADIDDSTLQYGDFTCCKCGALLFSTEDEVLGYARGLEDMREEPRHA